MHQNMECFLPKTTKIGHNLSEKNVFYALSFLLSGGFGWKRKLSMKILFLPSK